MILPSAWGAASYKNVFEGNGLTKLKDWISDGGTLIGVGGAAAFLADSSSGLSNVKLRRQTLKDLKLYQDALQKEQLSKNITIDSLGVWEDKLSDNVEIAADTEKENEFKKKNYITYANLIKNVNNDGRLLIIWPGRHPHADLHRSRLGDRKR